MLSITNFHIYFSSFTINKLAFHHLYLAQLVNLIHAIKMFVISDTADRSDHLLLFSARYCSRAPASYRSSYRACTRPLCTHTPLAIDSRYFTSVRLYFKYYLLCFTLFYATIGTFTRWNDTMKYFLRMILVSMHYIMPVVLLICEFSLGYTEFTLLLCVGSYYG